MSLIVEDGTGLSTAESYGSVTEANTYHTAFGNSTWTGTDAVKEAALRRATQYIDSRYGGRWLGCAVVETQALNWPRWDVMGPNGFYIDNDVVPVQVKRACFELALRALTAALAPDQDGSGAIASESVTVGPITDSKSYVGGLSQQPVYKIVNDLLRPLLTTTMELERS